MVSEHINWISVLLILLFLLPLISGMLRPLTESRIFGAFSAVLSWAAFIVSAGLSLIITNTAFDSGGTSPLRQIPALQEAVDRQDILAYALVLLVLLLLFGGVLHLLMLPVTKLLVLPLSARLAGWLEVTRRFVHRLISAAWEIPRAAAMVILLCMILSFYTALSGNAAFCKYINDSKAYRLVEAGAVRPIIDSQTARAIPPLLDSTMNRVVNCLSPEGRRLLIRVYINGITVEEAVRSNPDIDNVAIDLVDTETDDYIKAKLLYDWICSRISYDKEKAETIAVDAFAVTSGSTVAFTERTGVCFDMACLYVSMCRAVDVPVRLITGQGFNGAEWEDHSWNQIYDVKADRWVNVDTTFGGANDYFDRLDFWDDHRYPEIQGQW